MSSELSELQEWYLSQCNGDWEHSYGVYIGTLDNPGWILNIDLADTELANIDFLEIRERYDNETNWIICSKQEEKFAANCGPLQLDRMIRIFLDWAEVNKTENEFGPMPVGADFETQMSAGER